MLVTSGTKWGHRREDSRSRWRFRFGRTATLSPSLLRAREYIHRPGGAPPFSRHAESASPAAAGSPHAAGPPALAAAAASDYTGLEPRKQEGAMYKLYDSAQDKLVGRLNQEQLTALANYMEEEFSDDTEYYLTSDDCSIMEEQGFDPELVRVLRDALAGRDDMDLRYEREA